MSEHSTVSSWAAVPLRLIVGGGFMAHGIAKLQHGPEHFSAMLGALGVPAPDVLGWATIVIEVLGGVGVLAGVWIPLLSLPMATILVVAAATVHWQYGFSSIKLQAITAEGARFGQPGYETDLLYLACLAALVIGGSGPWSIARAFRKRKASAAR
jgi:putative oxidoreductase